MEPPFAFEPKAGGKRPVLVPVGGGPASDCCFQTGTPLKRIGNVTISTIRRPPGDRTPLRPVAATPLPQLGISNFYQNGFGGADDKENVDPRTILGGERAKPHHRLDSPLRSRGFDPQPSFADPEFAFEDPVAPWDALEKIIRLSIPDGIDSQPIRKPQPRQLQDHLALQSEGSQLEELLFSNDPVTEDGDVFLGFDQPPLETCHWIPRPRSSSMVSVASRASHRKLPASKIEVRVRTSRRDLPTLRSGSHLRKMTIPATAPARNTEEAGSGGQEYATFLNKFHADEPVDSEPSDDDEFSVEQEPVDEEDALGPDATTKIPKWEIENLVADDWSCQDTSCRPRLLPVEDDETVPSPEELEQIIASQAAAHFQLLVQVLGLCGEVRGAEDHSRTVLKLLVQFKTIIPAAHRPSTIDRLDLLLRTLPEAVRQREFGAGLKADPLLRPRSNVRTTGSIVFKFGTPADPYGLSRAYTNLMALFEADLDPAFAFHMSPLVDNTAALGTDMAYYGKRNDCFLQSEDALLLLGLKTFGLGNWEAIHARFLPMRTTRQISVRYKNLVSRRAPSNPIKAFVEGLWRPLSRNEEDLIYRGVQRFGKDFKLISQHYLPHRPPTILRNLWTQMDEARRKSMHSIDNNK